MDHGIIRCLMFILFLLIQFAPSHAADLEKSPIIDPELKVRTHTQLQDKEDNLSSSSLKASTKPAQKLPIKLGAKPVEQLLTDIAGLVEQVISQEHPLVKVHVMVAQTRMGEFHMSFSKLVAKHPFPFTWSTENKGIVAKSSPPLHKVELHLSSLAKLRRQVEHQFIYKVSEEDQKRLHWNLIYDLAMRSNLSVADFRFNKALKVRLLTLEGKSADANIREMHQFVKTKLPKDTEPFHIVGFEVPKGIKASTLLSSFSRTAFQDNSIEERGMIYDDTKGCIYVCLTNVTREMLDLHGKKTTDGKYDGRTVKDAAPETTGFVQDAFYNFQDEVTVLTGRGNHTTNGKSGVLKQAFKTWAQDLAPLITGSHLIKGDGGYKVKLRKAPSFNLQGLSLKDAIPQLHAAIAKAAQSGDTRLRLLLDPSHKGASEAEGHVLFARYTHFLVLGGYDFSFSMATVPGELRLIFDKAPAVAVGNGG